MNRHSSSTPLLGITTAFLLALLPLKTADAQDVVLLPDAGQPSSMEVFVKPVDADETKDTLSALLYHPDHYREGRRHGLVKALPPEPRYADLPMFQKQMDLQEPERRRIEEPQKQRPTRRVPRDLPLPLTASGDTTADEDGHLDRILQSMNENGEAAPEEYRIQALKDYIRIHPDSAWNNALQANIEALSSKK